MDKSNMVMESDSLHEIITRYRNGEMFYVENFGGKFMPMITEEQLVQWSFLSAIYSYKPEKSAAERFVEALGRSEGFNKYSITSQGDVKIRDDGTNKSVIITNEELELALKCIGGKG